MLKDDRMMGMLTFMVILVAAGTLAQRAELLEPLFGTAAPEPVLNPDVAEARAGEPAAIDVLANDTGVADPAGLAITAPPECGRARVRGGEIRYTPTSDCLGTQRLRYGLGTDGPSAELRITVGPGEQGDGKFANLIRPGAPEPGGSAEAPESAEAAGSAEAPGSAEASAAKPEAPSRRQAAASAATDPAPAPSELAANRAGPADAGAQTGTAQPGASAAQAGQKCNLAPTLTVAAKPAAVTEVAVDSPCDRDAVAVLAYDGLRFAIPLNFRGAGRLEVPGFQRSTEATLTLRRGGELRFDLPFEGIERIDRVAIAWEAPPALALNAFEFGARPGAQGHLSPEAPRSFEAVRREGGGWLASYEPAQAKGQRIDVYSFWRRLGGPSGVVKLALDPGGAAAGGATGDGLCSGSQPGGGNPGGGADGAADGGADGGAVGADYVVLRSIGGRLERARLGRVAPLDCTVLAGGSRRYIENAVDDLIVRRR